VALLRESAALLDGLEQTATANNANTANTIVIEYLVTIIFLLQE